MMCMYIATLIVLFIAPNATMVGYGILFGGMHPESKMGKMHTTVGLPDDPSIVVCSER